MLPSLAFGDRSVTEITDTQRGSIAHGNTFPQLDEFQSLIDRRKFLFKSSHLVIDGLRIDCLANTPVQVERIDETGNGLWIPVHGSSVIETKGSNFYYASGFAAFIGTNGKRLIRTSTRSDVCIRFDYQRLNETYAVMAGFEKPRNWVAKPQTLPLNTSQFSFSEQFAKLFQQIDALESNTDSLRNQGFSESIYRLIVIMLHPELVDAAIPDSPKDIRPRNEIRRLCEFMNANLTKPISLTEMEEKSGLSARVLQYEFQRSFGLRPREWLLKQRLHAAHALLDKPDQEIKLTSLAYDFCFASPSDFARRYQAQFGEVPSQTLARRRSLIQP